MHRPPCRPLRAFDNTTFLSMVSPFFPFPRSFVWVFPPMSTTTISIRQIMETETVTTIPERRQPPWQSRAVGLAPALEVGAGPVSTLPIWKLPAIPMKYVICWIFVLCFVVVVSLACIVYPLRPVRFLFVCRFYWNSSCSKRRLLDVINFLFQEEAYLQEAIRQSLKPEAKPPTDLLSLNDPEPSHVAPPSTAVLSTVNSDVFSAAGETIQSDPYASHTGGAVGHQPYHQSFTSLPAMSSGAVTTSNGYGAPDFASASPPGALVVAPTQSAGYLGYSLTNVPVTSAPNNPYGAAVPPPAASANPYAPTNPYAPPTTAAATNPYGAAPVPTPTNPYGSPTAAATASTNPYGVMTSSSIVPANPYGAPPPAVAETNPYGSPPVAPSGPAIPYGAPTAAPSGPTNPYGAMVVAPSGSTNPYGAPGVAVATTNPYGAPDTKSTWTPPAPISTQPNPYDSTQPNRPYDTFNRAVPPAVTPHAQQTPSSLGFGSPAPDFSGFSPALNNASYGEEKPSLNVNSLSINDEIGRDHVGETMKSAVPASFIDQTYAKLANFDNFSVESKRDAPMANPFDITSSSTVGGNKSLADMSKNKVRLQLVLFSQVVKIGTSASHKCVCSAKAGQRNYENSRPYTSHGCFQRGAGSVWESIWNSATTTLRSTATTIHVRSKFVCWSTADTTTINGGVI